MVYTALSYEQSLYVCKYKVSPSAEIPKNEGGVMYMFTKCTRTCTGKFSLGEEFHSCTHVSTSCI